MTWFPTAVERESCKVRQSLCIVELPTALVSVVLVMADVLCFCLSESLERALHWNEHCTGTSVALERALHWDERCIGTSVALGQALHWDERCTGTSVALERALHWNEHCLGT